ncbi:hypothetical protein HLH36_16915 [Gluconacetobacter aggeris]|uniref:Uncharacterized protein n=2 Tax=Gluconacetobacter TaxID=89583 RepID=A0A7W4NSI4_9PROT|nr:MULTISPECIES: hypothetical protein [Gluconacetobacter]MBB2164547.1 hypothetical protein [Gluconacetobacter dulcium]MBB2170007.1 hypothetical protein [Gluconacetobacter aggeris]MBB2193686.1 hypothetical protein [Gluconacetobacter dulcium]
MTRNTSDPDLNAARAAARRFGSEAMIFEDLAVGERFCFAGSSSQTVCIKIRRRRYSLDGRVCYATATRAVVRSA